MATDDFFSPSLFLSQPHPLLNADSQLTNKFFFFFQDTVRISVLIWLHAQLSSEHLHIKYKWQQLQGHRGLQAALTLESFWHNTNLVIFCPVLLQAKIC